MDEKEKELHAQEGADSASQRSASRGFKPLGFVKSSWAELQRVQWPTRQQVAQATIIVLVFVLVVGLFLGLADNFARKLVDLIV